MSFSHIKKNKNVNMVDITSKKNSLRVAKAEGTIVFNKKIFDKIISDKSPKGEIFNTARLAGIMAAKKTHELIPLCHNININSVKIDFKNKNHSIQITSTVKTNYKTGVEMEALTSCTIACLTIYDMCKSISKKIVIEKIKLVKKSGGKSGDYVNEDI